MNGRGRPWMYLGALNGVIIRGPLRSMLRDMLCIDWGEPLACYTIEYTLEIWGQISYVMLALVTFCTPWPITTAPPSGGAFNSILFNDNWKAWKDECPSISTACYTIED